MSRFITLYPGDLLITGTPAGVGISVLSGTHKELKKLVADGTFREDLFYRLNVLPIRVPALRERADDIPLLAKYFCRRVCEKNNIKEKPLDEEVLWELKQYRWPGNVRELQNVMERIVIMSGDRISTLLDLSAIALAAAVPAHGLTMAVCLALMGVLSHVAYRDIFDARSGNRLRVAEQIHAGGSFGSSRNHNCENSGCRTPAD